MTQLNFRTKFDFVTWNITRPNGKVFTFGGVFFKVLTVYDCTKINKVNFYSNMY
jgi:hypothetical protein